MAASVLALIRKRYDDIIKKNYQPQSEKGSPFGYANLDAAATIPPTSLPDLPASTVLGRGSAAGAGPSETITLGANLTMTGTVLAATGGGGAPAAAQYLVGAADAGLPNARLPTDTPTVAWDLATPLQASANVRDESVSDAKLRQSSARSVIGRAFFDAGSPADIIASVDGHVLRRAGVDIGFGLIPEASVTNLVTDLAARVPTSRLINTTAPIAGGGDLSLDRTISLNDDGVTNAKLANVATGTFKGRVTAATGDPEDLSGTQATTMLDVFTSILKGLVPLSGGGTANFLRADGAWIPPAGGGGGFTTIGVQKFLTTGAGTYTPTASMKFCIIFCTGAGGGGGAAKTLAGGSGDVGVGGGGASGATWIGVFSAAEIGASKAITVGAGGAFGVTPGGNGGNGGSSSVATLGTAGGGSGGVGSGNTTQDAKTASGGLVVGTNSGLSKPAILNLCGQFGEDGWAGAVDGTTDLITGKAGDGADSFWGPGGAGRAGAQTSLVADFIFAGREPGLVGQPSRPGAGGSGAIIFTTTSNANGGQGADGMVYIIEFI